MRKRSTSFLDLLEKASFLKHELKEKLRKLILVNMGIRAYDPKFRKTNLASPLTVQVQTIDRCNASCIMCPYSSLEKTGPPNIMEEDLYARILNELEGVRTLRSFTLMLQNEPLLDTRIAERVRDAQKTFTHNVLVNIVTNGALLTSKQINELIEADIDTLSVSIYAFRENTYKSIHKGLDFSKVVNNVQLLLERKTRRTKVIARFLKQQANKGEEKEFIRYWEARGADVLLQKVVNRAGTLKSFDHIKRPETKPIKLFIRRILNRTFPCCPLPFITMTFLGQFA